MSYGSSLAVGRPVTTQTTPAVNLRTSTPKVVYPSARQMTTQRCCETGRPVMIDPVTGGTICSCQLKSGLPAYLSRVPSLPETIYSAACSQFQQSLAMNADSPTAFYQVQGLKPDRAADGLKLPPSGLHAPYYLEHYMAAHPYNTFYPGFDLNSARRKNATRETTSALKAWLYEHRKNPYPTKGEKIMLAIITRMTLTQVSTWFANARRRLKKESKMDDKDGDDMLDLDDIDVDDTSDKNTVSRLSESTDGGHTSAELSDISDAEDSITQSPNSPTNSHRLYSPKENIHCVSKPEVNSDLSKDYTNSYATKSSPSSTKTGDDVMSRDTNSKKTTERDNDAARPKIWSISEIISSKQSSK